MVFGKLWETFPQGAGKLKLVGELGSQSGRSGVYRKATARWSLGSRKSSEVA